MLINNNYHHKLFDGLASCLTKLSEFDQAIEVYKQIFQREEGKKNGMHSVQSSSSIN